MLRRQLPVHSPLAADAVLAGIRSALRGGQAARERVQECLQEKFGAEEVVFTDFSSPLALALGAVHRRLARPAPCPPTYGCSALATVADAADVTLALYDLSPSSLTLRLNPGPLREAASGGGRPWWSPTLYGVPIDMDPVREVADKTGIVKACLR